jgi:glutathione S-transferase
LAHGLSRVTNHRYAAAILIQPEPPAMADLLLYHAPQSRSAMTRWLLEELGQPYEIKLMNLREGPQYTPEFRALNPMAKLPTIVYRGVPVSEGAAICTFLADEFPAAKLNKPIGDPERGPYLKWLFFGPSCVEPAITDKAFPRAAPPPRVAVGYGDFDSVLEVLIGAVGKAPYLFGEHFTAADIVIGSAIRYGMLFGLLPDLPEFKEYVGRLEARPAFQRAAAKDKELVDAS